MAHMSILSWLKRLVSGKPHIVIGDPDQPYLLRWYLLPRNPICNLYLHKFLRSDDDRALHDHPWWFISVILRGHYIEILDRPGTCRRYLWREFPSIILRRSTDRHRIVLNDDRFHRPIPCWTIVLTGPKVRDWGFWCAQGFVPWQEFCDPVDGSRIGKGCGE